MAWYGSPNKKKKPKVQADSTPKQQEVSAANVEEKETIIYTPFVQPEPVPVVIKVEPVIETPIVTENPLVEEVPVIIVPVQEPEPVVVEPEVFTVEEPVKIEDEIIQPVVETKPEQIVIESEPVKIITEEIKDVIPESFEEVSIGDEPDSESEFELNPLDILNMAQLPDDAEVVLTQEQLNQMVSRIKENVKESITPKGESGALEPVFPIDSAAEKFRQLSKKPFELRFKGVKIFDTYTNKKKVIFELDYLWIGDRKYTYQNLTITNK